MSEGDEQSGVEDAEHDEDDAGLEIFEVVHCELWVNKVRM
jgi:hypothetical protein